LASGRDEARPVPHFKQSLRGATTSAAAAVAAGPAAADAEYWAAVGRRTCYLLLWL
jgi:hypothetical protein